MNDILIGVFIGICIYSLILTIVTLYKDNSSYFSVESLDVIVAGPAAWLLALIFVMIRPLCTKIYEKQKKKKKPYTPKNKQYIKKVVRKIVKNYSKKKYNNCYFDFSRYFSGQYDDICGYNDLLVKKARNEKVNNQFTNLMNHQMEETIEELKYYFIIVTKEVMEDDEYESWFIAENKGKTLYKLRKDIIW